MNDFREGNNQPGDARERYEKLYFMLLHAIPSSVLMLDLNLRIVSANRNFLEKSRLIESDAIGRKLEEIFPDIIMDHMNIAQQIHHVFETNEPSSGQRLSYRAPGLPMRIYYYRILPFSWNGVVESVMLLMDDVTEQIRLSEEVRRVELHLACVVESASDIVLSTDINGEILSWNHAAEKISGYLYYEVKGQHFFNYFTEHARENIKNVFSRMKDYDTARMAEWELVPKQGEPIPVSWVCSPMKNRVKTTGIVAVGRDLTEYRKLEAQLLHSQKFAALGVMAGGIAHEIRNPLAICSSAAQFLMDDDNISPEFRKECANKIHTGIQRTSIIIENLLRYSRPSAEPDAVEVNLTFLIHDTLALVSNQAKIQKVELKPYLPQEEIRIKGNSSLLQQVFVNIFLNGIEAMPNGGTLTISMEKSNGDIVISTIDTGKGISKENIGKVFDPFYTTSPVGKGTGLGLSICYSIVQQHLGSVSVESDEGRGSAFTIRLPVLDKR